MKLTKPQQRVLSAISACGKVSIEARGRLVRDAIGKVTASTGAEVAARLVAFGLVTGADGFLFLTDYGKRMIGPVWASMEKTT